MSALATGAYLAQFEGANADVATTPGQWSVVHAPAAATQATASRAAKAGFRHVAQTVTATLAAGTTVPGAATQVTVNLRDGATGAGTIIWSAQIALPATIAATAQPIILSGLNLVGSVNTAMTLEFSGAGATNTFEAVTLTGYDIAA